MSAVNETITSGRVAEQLAKGDEDVVAIGGTVASNGRLFIFLFLFLLLL